MTAVELHPRLREAIERWTRGETPLTMSEIAPLPVRFPDGRTIAFGELHPDQLSELAAALRNQATQDYHAMTTEWDA